MGSKQQLYEQLSLQETCYYCGRKTVKAAATPDAQVRMDMRTLDHVWPRWMGSWAICPHNIVSACFQCNRSKADLSPVEWAQMRRGEGFPGESWRSWESIIGLGDEREVKTEVAWTIGQIVRGEP